jgi:uridine kinase
VLSFADVAARVLAGPARLGPVRLVAVDGGAGAGKSTFARRLAVALRQAGADVAELHTDDLLEGWTDLVSFWPRLEEWVLAPLRRGEPGSYRVYDWHARRFADEWQPLPVPNVLVIEGVSCARAAIRAELTLLVWVAVSADVRLARGLERDGEAMRAEWVRWMASEAEHFARDATETAADLRVDGAPEGFSINPETELVGEISGWTRLTA